MTEIATQHYLATPTCGNGSGLLVLHAWWGLNYFTCLFCDLLAQAGYVVLAPDLFSGHVAQTPGEAEELVNSLGEADDLPAKILDAVQVLQNHPGVEKPQLGVIAFSFGAAWALWLAQERPELLRAVALFYGTNGGVGDFSQGSAAFLGHFAADDPFEPPETVQALQASLRRDGRPATFHTYPGAGHWFFEADRDEAYHPQAAQLAWERTLTFLCKEIG